MDILGRLRIAKYLLLFVLITNFAVAILGGVSASIYFINFPVWVETIQQSSHQKSPDEQLASAGGLQQTLDEMRFAYRLLLVSGSLAVLFGLILPIVIGVVFKRILQKVREEFQSWFAETVSEWVQTQKSFGQEAFQRIEFWVEIILLGIQRMGLFSQHPAVIIASDMALVLRRELQRKTREADASASTSPVEEI